MIPKTAKLYASPKIEIFTMTAQDVITTLSSWNGEDTEKIPDTWYGNN